MPGRWPLFFVADTLSAWVLMLAGVVAIAVFAKPAKPSIVTQGVYAVVVEWPRTSEDDVDSWVRDPAGNVVWFDDANAGLMHLEHDDRGLEGDTLRETRVRFNGERVVLRGFLIGEYVVNVHLYRKEGSAATPVRVTLYRIAGGADTPVARRRVVLGPEGDEQTAFRFSVNRAGGIGEISRLREQLVTAQASAPRRRNP